MRQKIEQMIETDFQLQKLFMTENPERIEYFDPAEKSGTLAPSRKSSASSSAKSASSKGSTQQASALCKQMVVNLFDLVVIWKKV